MMKSWESLASEVILQSPHMQVRQDTVKLPAGNIIEDYSVADTPHGVLVVATDEHDQMILFEEYKYAVDDTVLTFPAGGIDGDESPLEAAARELLEETGYESTELELLAALYPYPSKINHIDYIVRAKNAIKVAEPIHESTETIGDVQLISVQSIPELIQQKKLNTTYMLAAMTLAFRS